MKKNIFILTLLAFLLIFTSLGIAGGTIKFAVVGPMTGDGAAMGIHERNGVQIAVDEINKSGGINGKMLKFVVGDDDQNPNLATVLAQKMTSDRDILFAVGHINSSCSISALPIYERKNLPLISGSNTNVQLTKMGHKNYFRIITPDDIAVKQLFLLGTKELGKKKPVIMWENTDYGKGMRDLMAGHLKEAGIKLLGEAAYLPGVDRDFSAHITKFKGLGVDLVFLMGNYNASALFMKQSRTFGLKAKFVAGGGSASTKLIDLAGEAAEGFMVVTAYDPNDERPKQAEFIKKFTDRFKEKPTEWSSHAYDIVYVAKKAIEAGGTTRKKLIEEIRKVKMHGITGEIEFDEFGDVSNKKQMVLLVKNGKFKTYIPTKY